MVHPSTVPASNAPGLEQNAQRFLRRAPGFTVFGENSPRSASLHQMPAWKLLVGRDAEQAARTPTQEAEGWALLVPPGVRNEAVAYGSYAALFIDPAHVAGSEPDRVVSLGRRCANELLDLFDSASVTELPDALTGVLETDRSPLAQAVRALDVSEDIGALADSLGVSVQHTRRLLQTSLGATFTQLQRWGRVVHAVELMVSANIADAAAGAGFADQTHLTRTSVQMLGRTPGSIRSGNR